MPGSGGIVAFAMLLFASLIFRGLFYEMLNSVGPCLTGIQSDLGLQKAGVLNI